MDPVAVLGDDLLRDPADLGVAFDFCPGLPNVSPFPDVGGDVLLESDSLDLDEVELLVTLVLGDGGGLVVAPGVVDFGEVELLVTLVLGGEVFVWVCRILITFWSSESPQSSTSVFSDTHCLLCPILHSRSVVSLGMLLSPWESFSPSELNIPSCSSSRASYLDTVWYK